MTQTRTPRNVFKNFYEELGQRTNQAMFDALVKSDSLKPKFTSAKLTALVVATIVHAVTIFLVIGGILFTVQGVSAGLAGIFVLSIGVLFLGVAWVIRPRFSKLPDDVVSRSKFPTLYQLADDVAMELGSRAVDFIAVNERYNATFWRNGLRRSRVMTIGLPLWAVLNDEERVGLVTHELAHNVNQDFNRHFYIETAINSLAYWFFVLYPDRLLDARRDYWAGIFVVPFRVLSVGLAHVSRWIGQGLIHLLWYESRRAEYLADYLAASVAGTDGTVSMLLKLGLAHTFIHMTQEISRSRYADNRDLFQEFRQQVLSSPLSWVSTPEKDRTPRLDVSHPPTAYRIQFLEARSKLEPKITLTPEQSQQIDVEMAQVRKQLQTRLIDIFRASAYNLEFVG